jgi:hypothetical protein
MIELLAHAALTTALLVDPPAPGALKTASANAFRVPRPYADRGFPQIPLPKSNWAPCIGAAVGAVTMGAAVADEEDFTKAGKLMWTGIGAAGGAAIGWLVGKIARP